MSEVISCVCQVVESKILAKKSNIWQVTLTTSFLSLTGPKNLIRRIWINASGISGRWSDWWRSSSILPAAISLKREQMHFVVKFTRFYLQPKSQESVWCPHDLASEQKAWHCSSLSGTRNAKYCVIAVSTAFISWLVFFPQMGLRCSWDPTSPANLSQWRKM